jgi:hypothetical protein
MHIIKNNPYRILGLLAGTSLKDQTRQTNRLKQFIDAEQEVTDDFSFPVFGDMIRTINSVNEAVSRLNLNNDRMNAAMFWFYNGSHIDEASFDTIKESNPEEAIDIWERKTASGEVSHSNHSAFQNLSTLKLITAFEKQAIDPLLLEEAISLKLKFLESDFLTQFKEEITDETYQVNKKELQLYFLNQLQLEVEKDGSISLQQFLEIINEQSFAAKEEFLNRFIQKPIAQIEKLIEASRATRKVQTEVIIAGDTLYKEARPILEALKAAFGLSNLKFQAICDKVSDEILQCGIQLFNEYRDHETYDAGEPAMDLFKKAKKLAIGKVAKQRYADNSERVQEWIDDKPNRDIDKKVGKDVEYIIELLNLAAATLKNEGKYPKGYNDPYSNLPFEQQPQNNEYRFATSQSTWERNPHSINLFRLSRDNVKSCKPKLENIKNTLGATNEMYKKLSNDLASLALACLIAYVNSQGDAKYGISPKINEHEINAMNAIGDLDMDYELRKRYNEQKQALTRLHSPVQGGTSPTGTSSPGGNCYIATMAYGDYHHPQVIVLRHFRDEVLAKSKGGRKFIHYYYTYSPQLVEKLKNYKLINVIIRKALDQFIKLIRK